MCFSSTVSDKCNNGVGGGLNFFQVSVTKEEGCKGVMDTCKRMISNDVSWNLAG